MTVTSQDRLRDQYLTVRRACGYGEPQKAPEGEVIAESEDGAVLRITDDAGAWWFRMEASGPVEWLARVHPDTRSFATCPMLARLMSPAVAKSTGWDLERWDAIMSLVTKQGTEVQSLVFSKDTFATEDAAKAWAKAHDFSFGDVDETDTSFRLRQFEPSACSSEPRTISLTDGVQAVICVRKSIEKHQVVPDPMMTGRQFRVVKTDTEKQYALGVVYGADDQPDAHGDTMTADEVERAAWSAVARGLKVGMEHEDGTTGVGVLVESYIWPAEDAKIGDQTVHKGDWLAGAVFDEPTWKKIKAGELTGWSLQGWARRVE